MRRVLATLVLVCVAVAVQAGKLSDEERRQLETLIKSADKGKIHELVLAVERDPLGKNAEIIRPGLMIYFWDVDYIVCVDQLVPVIRSKRDEHKLVWYQLIFGSGDFVLQNPTRATDQYAYTLAGLESALRVYRAILVEHPKARLAFLDELVTLHDEGRLGEHVKAHLCDEGDAASPN